MHAWLHAWATWAKIPPVSSTELLHMCMRHFYKNTVAMLESAYAGQSAALPPDHIGHAWRAGEQRLVALFTGPFGTMYSASASCSSTRPSHLTNCTDQGARRQCALAHRSKLGPARQPRHLVIIRASSDSIDTSAAGQTFDGAL